MAKKKLSKRKAARGTVSVRQVKSIVGTNRKMRECVKGLGLRRIGHTRILEDTPAIRGMIFKVRHLVEIVEGDSK